MCMVNHIVLSKYTANYCMFIQHQKVRKIQTHKPVILITKSDKSDPSQIPIINVPALGHCIRSTFSLYWIIPILNI